MPDGKPGVLPGGSASRNETTQDGRIEVGAVPASRCLKVLVWNDTDLRVRRISHAQKGLG